MAKTYRIYQRGNYGSRTSYPLTYSKDIKTLVSKVDSDKRMTSEEILRQYDICEPHSIQLITATRLRELIGR